MFATQKCNVKITNELCKGTYGVVYETSATSKQSGAPLSNNSTEFVVKALQPSNILSHEEMKTMAKTESSIAGQLYANVASPVIDSADGKIYLVMERAPGKDLFDIAEEVAQLPLNVRLSLITQLTSQVSILHHSSPRAAAPTYHGDIKEENIKINIITDKNGQKIARLYLMDFGLSASYEEKESPDKLKPTRRYILANSNYSAPETLDVTGHFGLPSDIYMMVLPILAILGRSSLAYITTPGPLPLSDIPKLPSVCKSSSAFYNINKIIAGFLNKMHHEDYKKRPNIDEVLMFFTTLQTLYSLYDAQQPDDQLDSKTKLIKKLWLIQSRVFKKSNTKVLNYITDHVDNQTCMVNINKQLSHCAKIATLLDRYNLFKEGEAAIKLLQSKDPEELLDVALDALQEPKQESLEACRANALGLIESLLDQTTNQKEFDCVTSKLDRLANSGRINYLYKRQGIFKFSAHNHTYRGKAVSHTWLKLQDMIEQKNAARQVAFWRQSTL